MHAEVISIGTELTTGAKLDTNSQWLSIELAQAGLPVMYHTTVADDLASNVGVLRTAVARSDIVLITGGLGPTLDDLTREAMAQLAAVPLVLHEPSLEVIRAMFQRRKRDMPERNRVQALFPQGSEPIANSQGTAPGIWMEVARPGLATCLLAAMPGVPSEMRVMFHEHILPRLRAAYGPVARVIKSARVNCFGLGESAAEELLGELTARGREPEIGITVHEATITLRIVARAATAELADAQIDQARQEICERLGEYVYGVEDLELEDVVVGALNCHGLKVATAELATGGLVAQRLSAVPGSQKCFAGGLIVPAQHALRELQPPAQAGEECPALHEQKFARLMAQSCLLRFSADYGLAVAALRSPPERGQVAAAPTIAIAVADQSTVDVCEFNLAGDPSIARSRMAKSALDMLRRRIRGQPARH
jgi:nicotinamide-nucleotide amidase